MDAVAGKVIKKYQSSTCEQLWAGKGKPKTPEEQRVIAFLRQDPGMRQAFFDKVAGFALAFASTQAFGWASANRFGGGSFHTVGNSGHENRWGGSTAHGIGQGTEHTNMYGGNIAHGVGGGTEHTNVYGGQTVGAYGQGAYHTYPSGMTAYHPAGYPPARRSSAPPT
jgi:hypothetical protein